MLTRLIFSRIKAVR